MIRLNSPRLWMLTFLPLTCAVPMSGLAQDKGVGVEAVKAADTLGAQRYAVIIGINDYHDSNIPDLHYAEDDARALHALLTDPQVGGIEPKNATMLLGAGASTRGVRKALADLRTLPKDATIFIFFSGHGAKESGEAFWVTQDAELGELAATAISNFDVQRYFAQVQTQRVITLLDCCYAAATVKDKSVVDLSEIMKQFVGKGRVTITASGSGEEAIEADDLKRGVFAHYLLQALAGAADGVNGPADGIVTLPELTAYIDKYVAEAARQRKGIQKPNIFMEEVQDPGKFLVAVDPRRILELSAEAQRMTRLIQARLDTLKKLFVDEAIGAEQYRLGKTLLEFAPEQLDKQDRERLSIFIDLLEARIPANRLQALLDSVETPEQRAARLERERVAALVTATLGMLDTAFSKKDGTEAYRLFDELKKLSPSHASIPDWSKRLDTLEPPYIERDGKLILSLGGRVKMELVLISAGTFMMGSEESESKERYAGESPQHLVRIGRPFYIGKYEVTQGQWKAVMGENPSEFEDCGDDCPVENVSWDDCQSFCRKLSSRIGKEVRLPSEPEWEYTCRAGTTTWYCFGDSYSGLDDYAWYDKNSDRKTHEVGGKRANDWGLYDVHGNVYEWCDDWYDRYPGSGATSDDFGQKKRVLRGGSWCNFLWDCYSASRHWGEPGDRTSNQGFRVVVSGGVAETP